MRIALVLLAAALLVTPAIGADIAKGPNVVDGVYTQYQNNVGNRADVLVVSVIAGTFTDLGPTWVGGFNTAGFSADLIYDPAGSWPAIGGYQCVTVDHSDNWWAGYWYAADESVLASYQDAGGCVFLLGQDFLYARGGYAGWPANYLGIAGAYEDANYNDTTQLDWQGTPGGPIDGLFGSLVPCFTANPWFTDEIYPASQGFVYWASGLYGPAEGGSVNVTKKGAFSAVEFGCGAQTGEIAAGIMTNLCGGVVPTQNTTWGQVKGLFR
jgi:hypothetical protein